MSHVNDVILHHHPRLDLGSQRSRKSLKVMDIQNA